MTHDSLVYVCNRCNKSAANFLSKSSFRMGSLSPICPPSRICPPFRSRVTPMNASCHTYKRVMSHTWSNETHMFAYRGVACTPTTHCNTLQHAATRCNMLQHAATRCNILQLRCILATHGYPKKKIAYGLGWASGLCNTLQHTATHCNTLQYTVTHRSMASDERHFPATHCNILQHNATHCTCREGDAHRHTRAQIWIYCICICVYIFI